MDDFNFILFRERPLVEIHAAHNGAVPLDRDTRGLETLRFEQLRDRFARKAVQRRPVYLDHRFPSHRNVK